MGLLEALILGIVEGLTEFLPISSTGHLILVNSLLNIEETPFVKAFDVIIQSGAMLAVIWHYRSFLTQTCLGVLKNEKSSREYMTCILIAFLPAAFLGFFFHKAIKQYLFSVEAVIWAMIVGGFVLLLSERKLKRRHDELKLNLTSAFKIGLFQCLALWPGTSRSMATILGGRLIGMNPKQAAEFSFILAIPTLMGAGVLDLYKNFDVLLQDSSNFLSLGVGILTSFFVALIVIRGLLKFLQKYSLEIFAWYRIFIGLALMLWFYWHSGN